MNTISNGELSDPLCDSVNRGLTLVRLSLYIFTRNSLPKKFESRIFTKWIGLSDFKYLFTPRNSYTLWAIPKYDFLRLNKYRILHSIFYLGPGIGPKRWYRPEPVGQGWDHLRANHILFISYALTYNIFWNHNARNCLLCKKFNLIWEKEHLHLSSNIQNYLHKRWLKKVHAKLHSMKVNRWQNAEYYMPMIYCWRCFLDREKNLERS